ncbi:MAG: hypothetical protein PVH68_04715 [Armatimonadota bacterium]|jgi:hypothetical protein
MSLTAGEALSAFRFVKLDSTADQVKYADYGDGAIGVVEEAVDSGDQAPVKRLHASASIKVEAACPLIYGDYLWPTTDGKAIPVGPGEPVARAIDASAAAGDVIEAIPVPGILEEVIDVHDNGAKVDASTTDDAALWVRDQVDTDSDNGDTIVCLESAGGGQVKLTTNDNASDMEQVQLNAEPFKLATYPLWMHCRIAQAAVDDDTLMFGLFIADATISAGVTDGLYFENGGDGDLDYVLEKDDSETQADTAVNMSNDAFVDCDMYFDGTNVRIFVDGAYIASPAVTNLPDDEHLAPAISLANGSAAASSVTWDDVHVRQIAGNA